ncbi:hypothetical protein AVEN_168395-1 [Araneus ventricosus]|uniref:Uncharacterized protein n=1 Tax=Araneus ventricosus TaxID=182803 RepID=A0A4Y2GNV5_ARAVE|nr:hypothetical protein AVEN_168395-1 [Araneus ventricosus]
MDSSAPFPLFSSLRLVGDINGRPSSLISPLRVPLMTTRPTAFSPLSEQQPAEIRPTTVEIVWPVKGGLVVRVLMTSAASRWRLGSHVPMSFWMLIVCLITLRSLSHPIYQIMDRVNSLPKYKQTITI